MNAAGGPLLTLHGYPVSNYHNAVHAALIEKGQSFAVNVTGASQDEAFLRRSPMGKIPFLETPDGDIAETVAILEYIEEVVPGPNLLPGDPFARARARQMMNVVQIYIETTMRGVFPGTFMGGVNSAAAVADTRAGLERGLGAVSRLARFDPFLASDRLTLADLFSFYTFDIARRLAAFVYDWQILDSIDGLRRWYGMMAERPSSKAVLAAFQPAFESYLDTKNAAYREPAAAGTHKQAKINA